MAIALNVPSVGESITEVEIGSWLKKQGEFVEKDEPIVEIESDKATIEVSAPVSGTITEIVIETGQAAAVGDLIGYIEEGAGNGKERSGTDAKSEEAPPAPEEKTATEPPQSTETPGDATAEGAIMPAAQRLLGEHGLDAAAVQATGPGGRLLKEDVQRHVDGGGAPKKETAPAKPAATPSTTGDGGRQEEVVRMTPLRRTIAGALVNAQQTMALLTTFNECDMSAVMDLRKEHKDRYLKQFDIKLGFMSFFVKAVIEGLKAFPAVNAEIRDDNIVYKNYYDIGIAVSGKKGLVVPVLRNAERMSFAQIELAISDMGRRARDGKITPEELSGGTFTITNGGTFGSLMSTPIVNAPQSAILGMHAIQNRPMVVDGDVVARPMMYTAITYDHRIIDGREAVSFLVRVKECIEDPARILLEI